MYALDKGANKKKTYKNKIEIELSNKNNNKKKDKKKKNEWSVNQKIISLQRPIFQSNKFSLCGKWKITKRVEGKRVRFLLTKKLI